MWLLTVPSTLYIVSKSDLDTLFRVQKCLIDSLSVLSEVAEAEKAEAAPSAATHDILPQLQASMQAVKTVYTI